MSSESTNMHVITENGEQCFMWRSNQLTYIAQDRQELPQVLATKFGPLATKLDLSYNTLTSFKNINMFTNLSELILDNNYLEDEQLDFKQNLRLKTLSLNKNKLTNLHKLIIAVKVCFPNLEFLSLIGNPLCPTPIFLGTSSTSGKKSRDGAKNGSSKQAQTDVIDLARLSAPATKGSNGSYDSMNDHHQQHHQASELSVGSCLTAQVIHDQQSEFVYQKYRYFIIYHLPNLRFLDSTPISSQERDEALKRCFWMESRNQSSKVNLNSSSSVSGVDNNGKGIVKSFIRASFDKNGCQALEEAEEERKVEEEEEEEEDYVDDGSSYNYSNSNNIFRNGQRLQVKGNNNGHSFPLAVLSMRNEGACHGEATSNGNQQQLQLQLQQQQQQPKGAFTRLSYKYTGKNSEGNRFIRNRDL